MMQAANAALSYPPDKVRSGVKDTLTAAPQFQGLDPETQRTIANSLVRIAHAAQLLEDQANCKPAVTPKATAMSAGDDFSGTAVNRVADTTRTILGAISFPRFVKELISGVFKAMVETNQQQLQQYVELTRAVSQSLEGFESLGSDDDAARRWLAERFPQSYRLEEPDPEDRAADRDEEHEPLRLITLGSAPSPEALKAALGLEANAEVPSGGAETLVPFVRRSLARNKQQMLATMVQMGMQRIVIDSGRIHAAMRFHIDASSAAEEARRTQFDTRTTIGARASGGFGFWSASASVDSTIGYVEANDQQTKEQLNASADLNSSVEIHFRTDQVPLDRIASSQTVDRLRLNTLNPERELQIAQQSDATRIGATKDIELARINRAPLQPAGQVQPTVTPPPAAPGNAGAQTGQQRQGGGQPGTQTQQGDTQTQQGNPQSQQGNTQTQQGATQGQQGSTQGQQGSTQTQQGATQGQQGSTQGQQGNAQAQQGNTQSQRDGTQGRQAQQGNTSQQPANQGQQSTNQTQQRATQGQAGAANPQGGAQTTQVPPPPPRGGSAQQGSQRR